MAGDDSQSPNPDPPSGVVGSVGSTGGYSFAARVNTLKSRWTILSKEIKDIVATGRKAVSDPELVNTFNGMFRSLDRTIEKFENTYEELSMLYGEANRSVEFPTSDHENSRANLKRYYFEACSIFESIAAEQRQRVGTSAAPTTSLNLTTGETRSFNSSLPKINIQRFNGELLSWPKFRDTYQSIVHSDTSLSDIQKFHYLISFIGGTAASVIKPFHLTAQNYPLAWKALTDAYDDKRMLAAAYLNQLLDFSPLQGKPTVEGLKTFSITITEAISSFKLLAIPNEADYILFHLAIKRLDPETRKEFEIANRAVNFPDVETLSAFVRNRYVAMQLTEGVSLSTSSKPSHPTSRDRTQQGSKPKTALLSKDNSKSGFSKDQNQENASQQPSKSPCIVCGSRHELPDCVKFANAPINQRHQWLKSWHGCKNCLLSSHSTDSCSSKWHCKFCKYRHHSLLHFSEGSSHNTSSSPSSSPNPAAVPNPGASTSALSSTTASEDMVILGTALAEIKDVNGRYQKIRLVLDSGSQSSFITQRCAHKLGLPIKRIPKQISGIGETAFEGTKGIVGCTIKPLSKDTPHLTTQAVVINKITSHLPSLALPSSTWHRYVSYKLADPVFWKPAPVDFLLGCDLFPEVMTGGVIRINDHLPTLSSSVFGHIVMGRLLTNTTETPIQSFFSRDSEPDLRLELQKFWELEEPSNCPTHDPEDIACDEHFTSTHFRLPSGRYVVRLPFKDQNPHLPTSSQLALKRFTNLEAKLIRNPDLKSQYNTFMQEYLELEHMSPIDSKSNYVIPHHSITKEDRSVIKLRVVFDASAPTVNGSLNDHLMSGPKLQADLRLILHNFRTHPIVFVADVVKMYRQILIDIQDRSYQHIFWRFHPSQALSKFQLNTITYGTKPAPFLALRVIKQLVKDEGEHFPLAAKVLSHDMYVDDLATGASSISDALSLQAEVIALLAKGGFALSKWASNTPELLSAVSNTSMEPVSLESSEDPSIKILGLQWDPKMDSFSYKLQLPEVRFTKRGILSTIARIFDPLGFLSPVILNAKSLIQELWKHELTWDQEIPSHVKQIWSEIFNDLSSLSQIKIQRFVLNCEDSQYQLVGFCDASTKGMCCVFYLRVIGQADNSEIHLITSKTKVAPVNTISVPRLELCSALLLSKTFHSLADFLNRLPGTVLPPLFFTDSTIALAWIKTPSYKLKVFVANRVTEINQLTSITSWGHVNSCDNPSDCGSRGLYPSEIIDHPLWWTGPNWLKQSVETWPVTGISSIERENLPEIKSSIALSAVVKFDANFVDWMKNISSYQKLIRVTAYVHRFINAWLLKFVKVSQNYRSLKKGPLSVSEMKYSSNSLFQLVQRTYFFKNDVSNATSIISQHFNKFSPFFDKHNVLRVGGRLQLSSLPESHKHPVLIPHESHLACLIVDHFHRIHLHPGPGLLQALIQMHFWIPSLRNLVKKRTFLCMKCYRLKACPDNPYMADLPESRFKAGRAFTHVGIDYAGPVLIRESLRRKAAVSKAYLCLFVCFSTKALHLECVSSLTTEGFMAAFDRFVSRRGLPAKVFSDCGTNFKGADNSLKELRTWFSNSATRDQLTNKMSNLNIEWIFNPPHAPHFGGLWEAGVKSVKSLLTKVMGETPLSFEELYTLFTKIEAILNSRPLCPISASPDDLSYLSPAHFLVGDTLLSVPAYIHLEDPDNRLSRWQLVQKKQQHFWKRWHQEYLCFLQQRKKWVEHAPPLSKGDLVIIKNDNQPMMSWPMARITKLHPSKDGIARVVSLRTADSSLVRPVHKIIPLWPLKTPAFDQ